MCYVVLLKITCYSASYIYLIPLYLPIEYARLVEYVLFMITVLCF